MDPRYVEVCSRTVFIVISHHIVNLTLQLSFFDFLLHITFQSNIGDSLCVLYRLLKERERKREILCSIDIHIIPDTFLSDAMSENVLVIKIRYNITHHLIQLRSIEMY